MYMVESYHMVKGTKDMLHEWMNEWVNEWVNEWMNTSTPWLAFRSDLKSPSAENIV